MKMGYNYQGLQTSDILKYRIAVFFCFVPLVGKSDHIYQEFSILIWTIEMQTIFDQFAKQQMSER